MVSVKALRYDVPNGDEPIETLTADGVWPVGSETSATTSASVDDVVSRKESVVKKFSGPNGIDVPLKKLIPPSPLVVV